MECPWIKKGSLTKCYQFMQNFQSEFERVCWIRIIRKAKKLIKEKKKAIYSFQLATCNVPKIQHESSLKPGLRMLRSIPGIKPWIRLFTRSSSSAASTLNVNLQQHQCENLWLVRDKLGFKICIFHYPPTSNRGNWNISLTKYSRFWHPARYSFGQH